MSKKKLKKVNPLTSSAEFAFTVDATLMPSP